MISTETEKYQSVKEYVDRVIQLWQQQRPFFPIDENYSRHLTEQLNDSFDDNLKKELIETTY
jgi:hypothetical protein